MPWRQSGLPTNTSLSLLSARSRNVQPLNLGCLRRSEFSCLRSVSRPCFPRSPAVVCLVGWRMFLMNVQEVPIGCHGAMPDRQRAASGSHRSALVCGVGCAGNFVAPCGWCRPLSSVCVNSQEPAAGSEHWRQPVCRGDDAAGTQCGASSATAAVLALHTSRSNIGVATAIETSAATAAIAATATAVAAAAAATAAHPTPVSTASAMG